MYDFYQALQTDTALVNRIESRMHELDAIFTSQGEAAAYSTAVRDKIYEIFRESNFNCGVLFPYFFPETLPPSDDAPEEGPRPLSLFNRPFAFALTDFSPMSETTIRGSRQLGKSATFCGRQLILSHIIPNWSSIYLAPHMTYMKTYANRMREMERHFRYFRTINGFRQNLAFKEYPNSSSITMVRVDTSASDIRSKTAEELIIDEAQHFDATFLPEAEQVLRAGTMKCKLFAGTSLDLDTFLEGKYQSGSMGTWHVRARNSKDWINCGDPEQVLPIIQPAGPTCPYTKQPLDMTDGLYVHEYESRAEEGFTSYHIPQIIIPEFVTSFRQWRPIYDMLQEYTRLGQLSKFIQEVLGIPVEEGSGEISEQDLKNICVLPDTLEALRERAIRGNYTLVISGVDWGGSDYNKVDRTKQSYTFHTILGITNDQKFDILHMEKYAGMHYQTVLDMIAKNHRLYKAGYIASDFSAGSIYNQMIHEQPGISPTKHFTLGYQAPNYRMVAKAQDSDLQNHYNINRTESLTYLFNIIKQANPRIRCYAWEKARHYLSDLLNIRRLPADIIAANPFFKYRRHGSKPDDGLHSINFAVTLGRMILDEPLFDDKALRRELQDKFRSGRRVSADPGGNSHLVVSG